ncbi:MAG: LLM class F420-dependent oxidoreductase [Deltaproteobacteria bacterium]|nr:LLM class F420-dependent oxidoreductase [Deltaproteobacteria bacterium]
MQYGFSSMNTHLQVQPAELAPAVEERGFESIWYGEHSQIPIDRKSPHPRDRELLDPYKYMMDPYVSLAVAGSVTRGLKLGTSVSLLLERELFSQAKTIMTLDRVTQGRLLLGIGVGWNQEQFENASALPWKRRFSAMRETVAALRTLWSQGQPEFHGDLLDFDPVWCNPKPVQQPGPPILFGAMGPVGLRHTADWADGWMPIDLHLEDAGRSIATMRRRVEKAGRDPASFEITMVVLSKATSEKLARFRDLGVDRCLVGAPMAVWDQPGEMMRELDRLTAIIQQVGT